MQTNKEYNEEIANLWRYWPHTYAAHASEGRFKIYPYIEYIAHRLQASLVGGGGRFIINLPPRHGKSEFLSKWLPAWYLDTFPGRNVILTSYGEQLATSFGRFVRNHFDFNTSAARVLDETSTAANRFDLAGGGAMITAGVGGPITGKGGHLLLIDDPYKNWEEASSANNRRSVQDWFETTFSTRQEPGATMIILQTRWHHDDLSGHLLKTYPKDWEVINLPALAEENDPLGRLPGQALCPERYDENALRQIQSSLADQFWLALYQQKPTKDGGEIIKREWWKYYDQQPLFTHKVQFWDTAQKPGITNDYSVCATYGKAHDGYYLIDRFRAKLAAPELEQAMIQEYNKHKPHVVQIEDASSGASMIQYLRRNTTIPVQAYTPIKDKVLRAINASSMIKSGLVKLPRNAPWLSEFLVEHDQFPASAHDDQVDTTSQMADYFNNFNTAQPRITFL